ncbi:MAG: CoA pyrophosphatase [Anaerolineales bacterium]
MTLDDPPSLTEADIARQLSRAKCAAGGSSVTEDRPFGRKAAVLVPMFRAEEGWRLLFTERSQSVEEHPGQVSFPGGQSHDPSEAGVETALRETEEEIGLASDQVRVLGQLDPLETVTGFLVTPIVGVFSWPALLRPSPIEVREIFHVPLRWLAQASNLQWLPRPKSAQGRLEWVPVYQPFEGHVIWGVTARIVVLLLGVLGIDLMPHAQGSRG